MDLCLSQVHLLCSSPQTPALSIPSCTSFPSHSQCLEFPLYTPHLIHMTLQQSISCLPCSSSFILLETSYCTFRTLFRRSLNYEAMNSQS